MFYKILFKKNGKYYVEDGEVCDFFKDIFGFHIEGAGEIRVYSALEIPKMLKKLKNKDVEVWEVEWDEDTGLFFKNNKIYTKYYLKPTRKVDLTDLKISQAEKRTFKFYLKFLKKLNLKPIPLKFKKRIKTCYGYYKSAFYGGKKQPVEIVLYSKGRKNFSYLDTLIHELTHYYLDVAFPYDWGGKHDLKFRAFFSLFKKCLQKNDTKKLKFFCKQLKKCF